MTIGSWHKFSIHIFHYFCIEILLVIQSDWNWYTGPQLLIFHLPRKGIDDLSEIVIKDMLFTIIQRYWCFLTNTVVIFDKMF